MSADFDQLCREAYGSEAGPESLDKLWSAVFHLEQWHFISRGNFPHPYPTLSYLEDQPMIHVFTDLERLKHFAENHGYSDEQGKILTLSFPVLEAVEYLEPFEFHGVYGIWFNPGETGFYTPLKNLRAIQQRVKKI